MLLPFLIHSFTTSTIAPIEKISNGQNVSHVQVPALLIQSRSHSILGMGRAEKVKLQLSIYLSPTAFTWYHKDIGKGVLGGPGYTCPDSNELSQSA